MNHTGTSAGLGCHEYDAPRQIQPVHIRGAEEWGGRTVIELHASNPKTYTDYNYTYTQDHQPQEFLCHAVDPILHGLPAPLG